MNAQFCSCGQGKLLVTNRPVLFEIHSKAAKFFKTFHVHFLVSGQEHCVFKREFMYV